MKRLLLIGIFLAITSSIFAKDEFTKSDAIDAICGNVGEYSQSVMRSRQLGENIANNIKVLNKTSKMSESTKQYYKHIIYEAYKEPVWSSKEYKENSITEFSNKMYLICAETFQKELSGIE